MTVTVRTPEGCPRCGCTDLTGHSGMSAGGEWSQTSCDGCEHRWGDGLPDSQDRPLPDGQIDCPRCDGEGGDFGSTCRACKGTGIRPMDTLHPRKRD